MLENYIYGCDVGSAISQAVSLSILCCIGGDTCVRHYQSLEL